MSIRSMTGFSRAEASHGPTRWAWEVRTVNGRNLDLRLRLPPGFDQLEPKIREAAAARFQRGSVQVGLNVKRDDGTASIRLNEQALAQAVAAAERIRAVTGGAPVTTDALLAVKGVIEASEPADSEAEVEARTAALSVSLGEALDGVVASRAAEGARLAKVLLGQLVEIERITEALAAHPARSVDVVKQRLREQVARLIEQTSVLDPARLHQEAMLLAAKTDIEEELKRLHVHIAAARDLITSREAVGRKLDFLTQEFNREANTVCSKVNDSGMTALGLSLKAVIEQLREQVQNIE